MTAGKGAAGATVHFPSSFEVDEHGVIIPPPAESLPAIAGAVAPTELLLFTNRLIKSAGRRRKLARWSRVNVRRIELAKLCIERLLEYPELYTAAE